MLKVIVVLSLVAVGCSSQNTSGLAAVVDQTSNDITVIRSYDNNESLGATYTSIASKKIFLDNCSVDKDDNGVKQLDCTDLAEKAIKIPFAKAYKIRDVRMADGRLYSNSDYCKIQTIEVAARQDSLNNATGIGFSVDGEIRVLDLKTLQRSGTVVSSGGTVYNIYKVAAPVLCTTSGWSGGSAGNNQTSSFKPFVLHKDANNEYRVWDSFSGNYIISAQNRTINRYKAVTGYIQR